MNDQKVKAKVKALNIRLPLDLWKYIHKTSIDRELSVNALINECLKKYQSNREKKIEKAVD